MRRIALPSVRRRKLGFVPGPQLQQRGPVEWRARVEVGQARDLRVLVPRAHQLAVVAAVDAVADQRPQLRSDRRRRARSSGRRCSAAHRAGTARRWPASGTRRCRPCNCRNARLTGCAGRQRQVDEDLAQEEHRAGLAVQRQRVLAAPADAAACGQFHFEHRRRIGEHARAERADLLAPADRPVTAAARATPCDSRGHVHRSTRWPASARCWRCHSIACQPGGGARAAGSPCAP